jgi:DNA replication and repair protein RecF
MYLKSLQLVNFKNYPFAEIELLPTMNFFTGNNGAGKTNILDALHYLSMSKSYLNSIDKQNIRFDQPFFVIQGLFEKEDKTVDIQCSVKVGSKKVLKRNKKEYEKLADHIGEFPTVMISPYDRNLISEGSELRRKWMDGIISQFNKDYLSDLQRYAKVLDQRNALLKNMFYNGFFDRESMEVWNDQMIKYGSKIHQTRKEFLEAFIPLFQKAYEYIGLEEEKVDLEYRSQLNEQDFSSLLADFQRKDAQSQYSNAGTHKDDLLFRMKGHPVKKFGSQGQQKSYLIALRLAQFEWLTKHLQTKPILLLDDIFDKLDSRRVERLMEMVSDDTFGQVLVTDTSEERLKSIFSKIQIPIRFFQVEDNQIGCLELNTKEQDGRA